LFAWRETHALAAHEAEVLLQQPEMCIKLGRFSCSLKSASSLRCVRCSLKSASSLSDLPDFLAMSERFACFSRFV